MMIHALVYPDKKTYLKHTPHRRKALSLVLGLYVLGNLPVDGRLYCCNLALRES